MAGRRFIYLCTLLGCGLFYVFYQEWLSWVLLMAVLGAPWLSLAVSLPAILSFRVTADVPRSLPLGTEGGTGILGAARYAVPPFLSRVRVERCITGERWQYRRSGPLKADHCGGLRVTPEKAWVCDYLGLFRFRVKQTEERTVLVYPKPAKMVTPPDLERYLAYRWRPKPGGGFAENHELRLYRPGDNLNQIHWKLTAKTGKLTIREPMEPDRGRVVLTMDISGTPEELDRKFGRLLWLGQTLLERNIRFEIRVMAADGIHNDVICHGDDLRKTLDILLCCGPVVTGSVRDQEILASWQYHIGGEPDEA